MADVHKTLSHMLDLFTGEAGGVPSQPVPQEAYEAQPAAE